MRVMIRSFTEKIRANADQRRKSEQDDSAVEAFEWLQSFRKAQTTINSIGLIDIRARTHAHSGSEDARSEYGTEIGKAIANPNLYKQM